MQLLSVLIPTIAGREAQYEALCKTIPVPVVSCCDNKQMSIGGKRQLLLDNCETEYFVMVDDDDSLAADYFEIILPILETKPDCVTYLEDINGASVAVHDNKYDYWHEKDGIYYRTPFYKDVIRTDIAKQIGFKDMRYGEDHDFSIRLKQSGLIKKSVFVNKKMYFYNMPDAMSRAEHEERYGIK